MAEHRPNIFDDDDLGFLDTPPPEPDRGPEPEPVEDAEIIEAPTDEPTEQQKQQLTKALARIPNQMVRSSIDDPEVFERKVQTITRQAKGRALGDPKKLLKLMQVMFIGDSLGIPPAVAADNIYIIDDKVVVGVHVLAGMMEADGWVRRVDHSDPPGQWCRVTASKNGRPDMKFTYTMDMAKQQGLVRNGSNWIKCPWNMLYARATATLSRMAVPHMATGLYHASEIDVETPTSGKAKLLDD